MKEKQHHFLIHIYAEDFENFIPIRIASFLPFFNSRFLQHRVALLKLLPSDYLFYAFYFSSLNQILFTDTYFNTLRGFLHLSIGFHLNLNKLVNWAEENFFAWVKGFERLGHCGGFKFKEELDSILGRARCSRPSKN